MENISQKTIKILMIDDHPMILEGYKKVLRSNRRISLDIATAKDSDHAVHAILQSKHEQPYDIVFIDIQIPESSDGTITSGEDLAHFTRKELPDAKILILTMHDNAYRLKNLMNMVPHDALMVKSDVTKRMLLDALDSALKDVKFYSKTVKVLQENITLNSKLLDEHDKKILYYISKGVLTKNLPQHIPLSLSSIEKRKNMIKQLFHIKGDDEQLLLEAKKRGFI
jgi:DNA-binding NarL/FixJ family response regulator